MSTVALPAVTAAAPPTMCPRGCGRPSRREPGSYCRECHAGYVAAWRADADLRRDALIGCRGGRHREYRKRPSPTRIIDWQAHVYDPSGQVRPPDCSGTLAGLLWLARRHDRRKS